MITAVSLNPSIDRTQQVESLTVGGLNRIEKQVDAAAGKGVNVALACSAIGEKAECIGFMFREGASLFDTRLHNCGVDTDFILCDGAVRVNTKVLDKSKGEITEFNAAGASVTENDLSQMTQLVRRHAANSDFMILSGSTPPGCPLEYYKLLGEVAAEAGVKVILDADGERLRAGLEAAPYMIKPNRFELEQLTGHILSSVDEVLDAAMACIVRGIHVVVVSLGSQGSIITDGKKAWRAYAPKIEIMSTVAAGDSMIAGLACAFARNYSLDDAIRLGTAAATARCVTDPNLPIDSLLCEKFFKEIQVEMLQ